LPEWICLKCKHRWVVEGEIEPRYCPVCGSQNIYVPKIVKPKYVYSEEEAKAAVSGYRSK